MCGFAGVFHRNGDRCTDELIREAAAMASALKHRGPDDSGEWADGAVGIALGFQRLSILDLSAAGHQPMISHSGRYVIAFNGEVYNFERIRAELPSDISYRGHSDTEVILAAIEAWGLPDAIRRFIGMFAFALWDRREHQLHLVRDRVGIKPLYYGVSGGAFLFGSELKALTKHPAFRASISREAISLFMQRGYVPAPLSIYGNVCKVEPGTIVTVHANALDEPTHRTYWSAAEVAAHGTANSFEGSPREAADQLDLLLRDSIRLRMISDVPLGVFLSGGVDSSTVAAVMQALSDRAVKTFTIGFQEEAYNEADDAKAIASHLGTDHCELYVTPADALAVVPALPRIFDEPFADSSQIPTYLVSQLARRSVTVSLSGDGGDELFGGYNRHVWGQRVWSRLRLMPNALRAAFASIIRAVPPSRWESLFSVLDGIMPVRARQRAPADKLLKIAGILDARTPDDLYARLTSQWDAASQLVRWDGSTPQTRGVAAAPQIDNFTLRMMYHDLTSYLPDDILVKVDRASMAVSLESREPLLDHRLIEFAWRVPLSMKVRDGEGKWLLRQVLYRYVPQRLIDRPKMGFGLPLGAWLRGALRDWAEDLLDERRLAQEGFLNPQPVRKAWLEHLSGKQNHEHRLWNVLMFQAWLEENRADRRSGVELSVGAHSRTFIADEEKVTR